MSTHIQHRAVALRTLRLLTLRDLKVRYSTSVLGYLWSVLEPLALSLIFWFIFTQMLDRQLGEDPYIVFLLCAMLPWMWFNGAISDATRAFLRDVRLVRSVALPRWVWVARIVCSKGIEFLLSLPVLAVFAVITGAEINWRIALYPVAVLFLACLTLGLGFIIAPLVVFFRDFERATKIILRMLFYASPIIYGASDLPASVSFVAWINPLSGIFSLFRAGFFAEQLNWGLVAVSGACSVAVLALGILVFSRNIGAVLKEL